jgi:hypothetical protein
MVHLDFEWNSSSSFWPDFIDPQLSSTWCTCRFEWNSSSSFWHFIGSHFIGSHFIGSHFIGSHFIIHLPIRHNGSRTQRRGAGSSVERL